MSKFIAQLLLSVVIGLGATAGFRSDIRGDVSKILPEAKVAINEKAKIDLKSNADVKTQASTSLSIKSKGKAAISAKVTAKGTGKWNVRLNTGGALSNNSVPGVSLNNSVNSQTDIGSSLQELDLEETIDDTLDLGLGLLE